MAGVGVGVRSQARDSLRVTEYEKQATPSPKGSEFKSFWDRGWGSVWVCAEEKEIWEQCNGLSVQLSRVSHPSICWRLKCVCARILKERKDWVTMVQFFRNHLWEAEETWDHFTSLLFLLIHFSDWLPQIRVIILRTILTTFREELYSNGLLYCHRESENLVFYLMTGWLFLPRWDTDVKPNYCWTEQILLELVNLHIWCVAFHPVMEISCLGEKILSSKNNHVGWVSPAQNERRFENSCIEVTNCEDFNRINHGWTPFLEASWILFIGWLSP